MRASGAQTYGDVSEWPMVPVSKTGVGKPTAGSNPAVSAARVWWNWQTRWV